MIDRLQTSLLVHCATVSTLHTNMADPSDPVVASYDVFLAPPIGVEPSGSSTTQSPSSKVLMLQYPAYRPSSRPYSAAKSQKPSELRHKPNTGMVEVDVPILTHEHYNHDLGTRYGKAISDSKSLHGSSAHGLAGGFHAGSSQAASLREIPVHDDIEANSPALSTQTLGGKIAQPCERDPIYFLGSLRNDSIHLSHLDGVVQLRPQLHHLDAEEEINQKRFQVGGNGPGVKPKAESEPGPSKLESRAIEIKLKDTKYEARDRTMNENTRLLRDIQTDSWGSHKWVDQDHDASHAARDRTLVSNESRDAAPHTCPGKLRSALSNGDWLDRMSAPREDGKKGLLAKLRGRERERARRKKAEEEKKQKSKASGAESNPGMGPLMEQSSDSEASSADATDVEMEKGMTENVRQHTDVHMEDAIEIKEEQDGGVEDSNTGQTGGPSSLRSAEKTGRPKKVHTVPIELDD